MATALSEISINPVDALKELFRNHSPFTLEGLCRELLRREMNLTLDELFSAVGMLLQSGFLECCEYSTTIVSIKLGQQTRSRQFALRYKCEC